VVTLFYLAYQVRQNTQALRAASRQQVVEGMRGHMKLRLEVGGGSSFQSGLERYPELPREELERFGGLMGDLALFMQGAFALYETGMLEEETWDAYLLFFLANLGTPGGRRWWELVGRPVFAKGMVRAVDARLGEDTPYDLLQIFDPPGATGPG